MIVYISGKITGDKDYKAKFALAEYDLTVAGFTVLNPARVEPIAGKHWDWYMRRAISLLLEADRIYLLPDWMNSKGARLEFEIASSLGIKPIFLKQSRKRKRS